MQSAAGVQFLVRVLHTRQQVSDDVITAENALRRIISASKRETMMESKIRLKLGPIEIDYEGSEAFLKQELPALLEAVTKLYKDSGISAAALTTGGTGAGSHGAGGTPIEGTTATYAAKLSVNSGSDLALAAAARLTFALNSTTFTRSKLLEEMKAGGQYYKTSYRANLSNIIASLMGSQKLTETATDTYALTPTCSADLKAKLAG
jgi:hypothetical protein